MSGWHYSREQRHGLLPPKSHLSRLDAFELWLRYRVSKIAEHREWERLPTAKYWEGWKRQRSGGAIQDEKATIQECLTCGTASRYVKCGYCLLYRNVLCAVRPVEVCCPRHWQDQWLRVSHRLPDECALSTCQNVSTSSSNIHSCYALVHCVQTCSIYLGKHAFSVAA